MPLNVDNSRNALAIIPILRLAFRPLFLVGTLFSVIAIGWWAIFWLYPFNWSPYGGPVWWHGHEMLYGFAAAIVAGFLLTAVQSWTGITGLRGKPLAVLVLSWLAGRIVIAFGTGLPDLLIVAVDMSYLLLATIAMAYPVIKAKQWQNLMFVPLLFVLALLNASSHWGVIASQPGLAMQSLHSTIMLFTLIIAIVGGRVIPSFTANATACQRKPPNKWLEATSIISIMLLLVFAFIGFNVISSGLLLLVSAIATLANGWRFLRWGIQYSWSVPLLWSLHLAYAFIPLGFIALALHAAGFMDNVSAALHSFTVGSIGGMILAMISRVTLGHTGRQLNPHPLVTLAYIFILSAALARVVLPAWLPEISYWGIGLAAIFWVLAYAIYIFFYAPMLVAARVDNRPG
ncbi:MAG: NnrS family protein [Gammaproteobacteria bacterium]|nr:NnrS family protein [Gammaproteobacteria bacterium]